MQTQLKTLLFQDKPIYYIEGADGINWVLIRPLCDVLGIDANRQIRDMKADILLAPHVSEYSVRLPANPTANPVHGVSSKTPREDQNEGHGVRSNIPREDEILGPERSVQTVQVTGDSKTRSYTCLPEEYIYGWLFSIQLSGAMKPETKAALTAYKGECYHALYQHFHGRIKAALDLEKEQALVAVELEAVEKRLHAKVQDDPDYQRKVELQAKQKLLRKAETQNRQHSKQQAFEFAVGVLEPAEE